MENSMIILKNLQNSKMKIFITKNIYYFLFLNYEYVKFDFDFQIVDTPDFYKFNFIELYFYFVGRQIIHLNSFNLF